VLDPSIPFSVHTAEGEVVDVRVAGQTLAGAGFRPSDPALNGYVVLDFDAFDTWHEEDEVNLGNPRDPFHRIDILQSRTWPGPTMIRSARRRRSADSLRSSTNGWTSCWTGPTWSAR